MKFKIGDRVNNHLIIDMWKNGPWKFTEKQLLKLFNESGTIIRCNGLGKKLLSRNEYFYTVKYDNCDSLMIQPESYLTLITNKDNKELIWI